MRSRSDAVAARAVVGRGWMRRVTHFVVLANETLLGCLKAWSFLGLYVAHGLSSISVSVVGALLENLE
jgi:hypothetical protein